jgi:tetratricopeptide (TPR) repeat protein
MLSARLIGSFALVLYIAFMHSPCRASELREVELLIQSGASGLALQVLDQVQPGLETNPEHWLEWENQRVKLYQHTKDWDGLIKRLQATPQWVPLDFRLWAEEEIARAQIEKKDTRAALHTLRKLIWSHSGDKDNTNLQQSLPVWRQLVIQAYLVAEKIADAELAMLRFQQDYPNPRGAWKRARATVLIRAGRPEDAEMLMAGDTHMHSRTIYYLAQLLGNKAKPKSIWLRTSKLAQNKKFADSTRRQFWLVASRAARQMGDYVSAIRALQNALVLVDDKEVLTQREKLLFAVNGDDLWTLYEEYGRKLGNKWQLLTGNDEAWFAKASNLVDKQKLQAMALFAAMSTDSSRLRTRTLAHELFASLLAKDKKGLLLVKRLYLTAADDIQLDKAVYIPEDLRHRLIDDALTHSDISTASRLIQTVTEPPKGANVLFWKMRRARIMILAGQVDDGILALDKLLQDSPSMQPDQIDRIIQVLFDLQTVGRHKEAINLFKNIPLEGQSGKLRREILYWIADSYKEQKQYYQAARYYLLSAGLFDNKAMDPWAQTARYHAADALVSGGDYEDAGRIYESLLKVTHEPGRKVVLKNKIQQIWLQSNQENQGSS